MPDTPEPLRDCVLWELRSGPRATRCELWGHRRGWELRVVEDGDLVRSKVERRRDLAEDVASDWYREVADVRRTLASWGRSVGLLTVVAMGFWGVVHYLRSTFPASEIQSVAALAQAVGAFFGAMAFGGLLISIYVQNRQLATQQAELNEQAKAVERDLFDRQFYQQLELVRAVGETVSIQGRDHTDADWAKSFKLAADDLFRQLLERVGHLEVDAQTVALGDHYTVYYRDPFGSYFRTLYRALLFVKHAPREVRQDDQRRYARLLRAQLSNHQLIVLLLNCLSQDGAPFLPLALEFEFFKVVSWPELTRESTMKILAYAQGLTDKYGDEWRANCRQPDRRGEVAEITG